jgi:hypothetical protein
MLREEISCYLGSHAFVSASGAANLGIPTCKKYIHFPVRNALAAGFDYIFIALNFPGITLDMATGMPKLIFACYQLAS